jgi:hypothetical protein
VGSTQRNATQRDRHHLAHPPFLFRLKEKEPVVVCLSRRQSIDAPALQSRRRLAGRGWFDNFNGREGSAENRRSGGTGVRQIPAFDRVSRAKSIRIVAWQRWASRKRSARGGGGGAGQETVVARPAVSPCKG